MTTLALVATLDPHGQIAPARRGADIDDDSLSAAIRRWGLEVLLQKALHHHLGRLKHWLDLSGDTGTSCRCLQALEALQATPRCLQRQVTEC